MEISPKKVILEAIEGAPKDTTLTSFILLPHLRDSLEAINKGDLSASEEMRIYIQGLESLNPPKFEAVLATIIKTTNPHIRTYFALDFDLNYIKDLHTTSSDQFAYINQYLESTKTKLIELFKMALIDTESQKLLVSFFEEYDSLIENRANTLIKLVDGYKKDFTKHLKHFLSSLTAINFENLEKDIESAHINCRDPLTYQNTAEGYVDPELDINLSLTWGPYHTTPNTLRDTTSLEYDFRDILAPRLRGFIFHELLHYITAKKIRLITHNSGHTNIALLNTGLRFTGFLGKERFTWLNEAITEKLAQQFAQQDEISTRGSSYADENELFDTLRKKSNNPDAWDSLFIAYFANVFEATPSEKIEMWRKARTKVEESIGDKDKNFLVKLDIFIEENGGMPEGVQKALEMVKKWEDGNPKPEDLILKKTKSDYL